MKGLFKGFAVAIVMTVASWSGAANAEQKIGLVDVQFVLQSLPQVATIEQSINAEFADQIQEVQRLRSDGQYLVEKLQREEATMSETQIKELQQQINDVGKQLQEKGQPLQQNMQIRTQQERDKLLGLIGQTVNLIADKEGYDMILSRNAVPFSKPEFDISQKVLDEVSKIK